MINEYSIFDVEGGCDAAMAAKLMQTGCTISQLCKEISNVAEQREKASLQRYVAYMHDARAKAAGRRSTPSTPLGAQPEPALFQCKPSDAQWAGSRIARPTRYDVSALKPRQRLYVA